MRRDAALTCGIRPNSLVTLYHTTHPKALVLRLQPDKKKAWWWWWWLGVDGANSTSFFSTQDANRFLCTTQNGDNKKKRPATKRVYTRDDATGYILGRYRWAHEQTAGEIDGEQDENIVPASPKALFPLFPEDEGGRGTENKNKSTSTQRKGRHGLQS